MAPKISFFFIEGVGITMVEIDYTFKVPKHNTLKLGKIFDLDTISTDTYKIILLSSVTGLVLNNLDKFDASMEAFESNPANYERTTVGLQLTETTNGYRIEVAGATATIPIVDATIAGILIIKESTGDILCADLNPVLTNQTSDMTLLFKSALWEIGEQVCTG